jgi:hypothetical protein
MRPDLETLVTAAYVFADEEAVPAQLGRPPLVSDAELIALAVCQAAMGISSDRQFLGLVDYRLPGCFPHLPDQTQYNRRLRSLTGLIVQVQQRLARELDAGRLRLADGTLIGVANYPGCAARSDFAPQASYGYCPSKSRYVWGVRLVVVSDRNGLPLGYTLVRAAEKEYEPVWELSSGEPGSTLIADKGLWGRGFKERLRLVGVELRTPARERTQQNRESERLLASTRLGIESLFANLKGQMRLEQHLAKTPLGLCQRIAQRLLALTLGAFLNRLLGRPLRSLVAYDGR